MFNQREQTLIRHRVFNRVGEWGLHLCFEVRVMFFSLQVIPTRSNGLNQELTQYKTNNDTYPLLYNCIPLSHMKTP